jgi:hypothetical protein
MAKSRCSIVINGNASKISLALKVVNISQPGAQGDKELFSRAGNNSISAKESPNK